MKRVAALLLCVLLCASLAAPAGAQAQKLLYPGTVIAGDHVYLVGIPLEGGSVRVTANGQEIPANVVSVAGAQLGVTYYCVASTTSSMSQVQRDQQYAGLTAINDALGANDSMVLVTMGRSVAFGEKLTDKEARTQAIDEATTPGTYGTNLYEGIDTVLKTIAEQEQGPSCVIFFAEGLDNSDIVKVTEEQAGRAVQNAGLCVNFVALLTPPVTTYARNGAERLERYATLSNGGICRVPLDMGDADSSNAAREAVQEMVSVVDGWAAIELNAADLPRDGKTVELSVTWTGNGVTMEDTASIAVADLPALPAPTEPETQPAPVLPTQAAVTESPVTAADVTAPSIPVYQDDDNQQQLYYVIVGSAIAMVLIAVAMVIVATQRTVNKKRMNEFQNDLPVEIHEIVEDPKEEEALEEKISEVQKLPPRRKAPPAPIPAAKPKQEQMKQEQPKPKPEQPKPQKEPKPKTEEKPLAKPEPAPEKKQKRRSAPVQPVQPTDEAFIIPSCTILLTPEGDPDNPVEVSIPVNGSCTFGRNQKAAVVLNGLDNALSGLHFELQWDGRVLYLADRNSTNGTALNGSPQRPGHWARVESGSVIQAGAGRYKVTIVKA